MNPNDIPFHECHFMNPKEQMGHLGLLACWGLFADSLVWRCWWQKHRPPVLRVIWGAVVAELLLPFPSSLFHLETPSMPAAMVAESHLFCDHQNPLTTTETVSPGGEYSSCLESSSVLNFWLTYSIKGFFFLSF